MTSSEKKREGRMLFLDLETSGLDPDKHVILELGVILVDQDLKPIHRMSHTFEAPPLPRMLDTVDMHRESGLLNDLADLSKTSSVAQVEHVLLDWLVGRHRIRARSLELAGFSIHFDRSFIHRHMPTFDGWLSHRMIDVSTIRGLYRRWRGEPREQASAHRALADCQEAIDELAFYRGALFDHGPARDGVAAGIAEAIAGAADV